MPRLLPPRIRNEKERQDTRACPAHRAWVRRHHCSVPGCARLPIECAHVRIGTDGGIALKPSDRFCISLCQSHHAEQHHIGEAAFEARHDIDLLAIAGEFARWSPHRRQLHL